jgi:peptidoglycan/LPS O-acetylase OafA/YrhL
MKQHEPALDGLRALAATSVVLFHVGFPLSGGGIRGVDIFFVLSGYLITSLLLNGPGMGYVDFWVRRLRRLMPALILFLATYVVVAPFILPAYANSRWLDALFALFYVSDQATAFRAMHGLGHAWSLAVEGQFYLLWPLVVKWLRRFSSSAAANILLLTWLAVTCARTLIYLKFGWHAAYYPSELHCSGLLLGAAVAFRPWTPKLGVPAALLLSALFFGERAADDSGPILWSIPLAEIGAAALISSLSRQTFLARILSWAPLSRYGLLSYGVYLWHYPFALALWGHRWWWTGPTVLLCASLCSAVSYLTVEAVFRRRRAVIAADPTSGKAELSVQPRPL